MVAKLVMRVSGEKSCKSVISSVRSIDRSRSAQNLPDNTVVTSTQYFFPRLTSGHSFDKYALVTSEHPHDPPAPCPVVQEDTNSETIPKLELNHSVFAPSRTQTTLTTHLSGFLSMQTVLLQCLRKDGGLSCTTCCTRSRVLRYSRKRFRNDTKCSAVRILPGIASARKTNQNKCSSSGYRKFPRKKTPF